MSASLQPSIFDPNSAPINRHAALVEREGIAWVLRFFPSVGMSPGRLRKLQAAKFARLAARGLPQAPYLELRLVCDFITWLFFYDDGFCDDIIGAHDSFDPLTRLHDTQAQMLAVLRGERPGPHDEVLVHMLADLVGRVSAWADPSLARRFSADIERYFESNLWELRNLLHNASPPLPLYIKMRPFTGAAPVVFNLLELVRHEALAEARQHVIVQEIELLANNAICWANDIASLDKEVHENNPHNLVSVLRRDFSLGHNEALARATTMQAAEEHGFEALAAISGEFKGLAAPRVQSYISDLRTFIRGNWVWMNETMRYRARLSMRSYGLVI